MASNSVGPARWHPTAWVQQDGGRSTTEAASVPGNGKKMLPSQVCPHEKETVRVGIFTRIQVSLEALSNLDVSSSFSLSPSPDSLN